MRWLGCLLQACGTRKETLGRRVAAAQLPRRRGGPTIFRMNQCGAVWGCTLGTQQLAAGLRDRV